jgi:hypothetical protein
MTAPSAVMRDRAITAEWVYGTILFMALVLGAADDDDATAGDVLTVAIGTMVVFFIAHTYAETIAGYSRGSRVVRPMRAAARHSLGLLGAIVLPSIPLVLSLFGAVAVDDAVDYSLIVGLIVLGATSAWAFITRKAPWWACILGTLAAVTLGFVVMLLDYIVH